MLIPGLVPGLVPGVRLLDAPIDGNTTPLPSGELLFQIAEQAPRAGGVELRPLFMLDEPRAGSLDLVLLRLLRLPPRDLGQETSRLVLHVRQRRSERLMQLVGAQGIDDLSS